jgi:Peptidase family C25.
MLEYPEVSDASAYGVTKPDATQALYNSIRSGTAIINYIGHGSAFQLAQEKLLDLNRGDLENIKANNQLPLWIVGTCSFGHFDDPISESFGEELIRYPMDAASAVISTCRPITVTGNERYTQDIFESLFKNGQVTDESIGICLQSIKNGSTESEYFHLFGDPAIKLPMVYKSFSNATVDPDTLKTLSTGEITIKPKFYFRRW